MLRAIDDKERAAAAMIGPADSEKFARVIEFTNVGLRYGHGPEILRDLSFRIEPGSFHFLTGPSGSGKTSLLRLLLLSLKPTSGQVKLFGRDVMSLDHDAMLDMRRHIGIVFQEFRLLDHLTTFENVALPLRVRGEPEELYRSNVTELLEWVGLGERMDALPPLLSGGEKQRAAIARAVIGRPDILLADEPTGNVDPELSLRLVRLFAELNKLGTTIILATHELPLLDAFDFPHMSLKDGQVVIDG
jgi:cell division transport system ATP-binding protein